MRSAIELAQGGLLILIFLHTISIISLKLDFSLPKLDNTQTMSLRTEGLRLTRISSKEPGGIAQLRLRPEGIYRGSGKTWGYSTADLSFAVHNRQIRNGQFLDLTSELAQPDGSVKVVQETLVYVKQDEKLPAKGEWGPHYFVKPESIGKGEPEIVTRGKEVSYWKSSDREITPEDEEKAKTVAGSFLEQRLCDRAILPPKPLS